MISDKWLQLLNHLQEQTHEFAPKEQLEDQLKSRFAFIKSQFGNINHQRDPAYIDWVEHETFTAVVSTQLQNQFFTKEELLIILDILFAAKLFQLVLSAIVSHSGLLEDYEKEIKRGMALQQLGSYQEADQAFSQATELKSEHYLGWFHLGYLSVCMGKLDKASDYFQRSIEKNANFSASYQNLAGCYYQSGEFENAAQCCERAQKLEPGILPSHITAISSYLALDRLEDSGRWLESAQQHQLDSPELNRLAGIHAFKEGDCEKAVKELSAYLAFNPEQFDVLEFRARTYAELRQWEALQADLDPLLNIDPMNTWCLEYRFLACYHTEQWEAADHTLSELIKLSESHRNQYRQEQADIRQKLGFIAAVSA